MEAYTDLQQKVKHLWTKFSYKLDNLPDSVITTLIVLLLLLLGSASKLVGLHGLTNWDEGWYVDICRNMLNRNDFFLPLYYNDITYSYQLFDKPLLTFWLGALSMSIFGHTTFAAKLPVAFSTGLTSVWVFLLFDHRHKENPKFRIIGIIAGILMSLSGFLNVYGRTAYIDPIITSLGMLTCMLAVRAIDFMFSGDKKRGWIYLSTTCIANALLIMAKAWQGLIFAPAIVLYFLIKLFMKYSDLNYLKAIFSNMTNLDSIKNENIIVRITYITSGLLCMIFFQLFSFIILDSSASSLKIYHITLFASPVFGFVCSIIFRTLLLELTSRDNHSKLLRKQVIFISAIISIISSVFISIFYDIFFSTFEIPVIHITDKYLNSVKVLISEIQGIELSQVLIVVVSALVTILMLILVTFILFAIFIGSAYFKDEKYITFLSYNFLPILPILTLGGWLVFWLYFLLIKGTYFGRDYLRIVLVGIIVTLILGSVISEIVKWFNSKIIKKTPYRELYSIFDSDEYNNILTFTAGAVIIVILSFVPFLTWLAWIDSELANLGYIIRMPGELSGKLPEFGDKIPSYAWLFFEYYLGWRYENPTHYSLYDSLNAFNDAFFAICIPLALIGIIGFIIDKEYDYLALFSTFFLSIIVVFFPAAFQLDYYYLPAMMPVFALAAKGMVFLYKRSALLIEDYIDTILLSVPFGLLFLAQFVSPIINDNLQGKSIEWYIQYGSIFLAFYAIIAIKVCRNMIDIFTLTGIMYFVSKYVIFNNIIYQYVPLIIGFTLPLIAIISLIAYLLMNDDSFKINKNVNKILSFIFILFLLSMAGLSANSNSTYWRLEANPEYERIAGYILENGGDYENSTYVFSEAGAKYCLSYYLNHNAMKFYGGQTSEGKIKPGYFWENSTDTMNGTSFYSFANRYSYIQFFVILQGEYYINRRLIPESTYSESYTWLKQNYEDVTETIGKLPWYLQVFANKTLIVENQ